MQPAASELAATVRSAATAGCLLSLLGGLLMMTSLADLRWHWADKYAFTCSDGIWSARPADAPAEILTADSADALRTLVRQDHAERHARKRTAQRSGSVDLSPRAFRGPACC
jgi:hypothetical protein